MGLVVGSRQPYSSVVYYEGRTKDIQYVAVLDTRC